MQILSKACGNYGTNCYILKGEKADIIIDPGVNASEFVEQNCSEIYAILNTHGHFDHVWDNALIKEKFKAPIYIHKNDNFMLNDPFKTGFTPSVADFLIEDENEILIGEFKFKFWHFAGHTPGCCMIELVSENLMFSGDFLFQRSIGRWDFEYSNAADMKKSLIKAGEISKDFILLPGHGEKTSLKEEQANFGAWLRYIG